MIQTSEAFAKAIEGNARQHRARFFSAGAVIDGAIKSVVVQKGSCGEAAFPWGALYSASLTAQIDRCTQSLENAELEFQIGLLTGNDEGSVEYVTVGLFTVTEEKTSAFTTNIVAIGRIGAKCGRLYVPTITFPATIGAIIDDLRTQTDCVINADAFADMLEMTIQVEPEGLLCREVLKILAELFGGFVTESNTGEIVFAKFSTEITTSVNADRTTGMFTFSGNDFTVTGVRVTTADEEEESGGTVFQTGEPNLQLTNQHVTQEIFDAMAANLVGYQYRPAEIPISLGDIRLESFDVLQVQDIGGAVYTVPCMSVVHTYDGGVKTTIHAPGDSESAQQSAEKGMLQQAVERLVVDVLRVKKLTAEKADIDLANIDTANISQAFIEAIFAKDITATGTIKGATLEGVTLNGEEIDISASYRADQDDGEAPYVYTQIQTGTSSIDIAPKTTVFSNEAEMESASTGGSGEASSEMTQSSALHNRYIMLRCGNQREESLIYLYPNRIEIKGVVNFSNGDTPHSALEPDIVDLDDLKTPGFYVFTQESSQTIVNMPIGGIASGSVVVIPEGTLGQVRQQVTRCSAGNREIWERLWYNDAWSAWVLLYSPHAIPTTPAMTARNDAEQTLTSTTATRVNIAYSRWATSNAANFLSLTGNGIKCLKAGYVEVSAKLLFKSGFSAGDHLRAWIYQNSTALYASSIHAATAASYYTVSLSPFVVSVSAGDMIYLYGQAARANTVIGYESAAHSCQLTVKYIG